MLLFFHLMVHVHVISVCTMFILFNVGIIFVLDSKVLQDTMVAHTNAVWGLSIHNTKSQLLSCSADGTVRLWSPGTKSPLLNTFTVDSGKGLSVLVFAISSLILLKLPTYFTFVLFL